MKRLTKLPILGLIALFAPLTACGGDGNDDPVPNDEIKVSETAVSAPAEGCAHSVTVTATGEWNASCNADWITLSKTGTTQKNGSVTLDIKANASTSARTADILFLSGHARATVKVTQDGKAPEPEDPTIDTPDGYTLVWHDEFDNGTTLDPDSWTHQVANPGWVNNELQTYVNGSYDGTRVTEIKDGKLLITATKLSDKVVSGRVYAKENSGWKYGIFEAKIRLPKGKGTWPAFWMMPVNNDFGTNPWPRCGEIDIMEEVGYHPDYTSSSIHCESYNHVKGTQKTAERHTAGAEDEFHVYRLEWTEDYIRTYVDGTLLLNFENDGRGKVETWPFNKPFYVILNLAWGGAWGGAQGVDESALPATMQVEYVRVFQKQ